jgi:hypothetical protein
MPAKKVTNQEIKIILQDSNHAKNFKSENLIHNSEFKNVLDLIMDATPVTQEDGDKEYVHNTITILGTRGSGKTSFLLSVQRRVTNHEDFPDEEATNKKLSNIEVLKIIDPTLIEEKGHVFLNVISAISEKVEEKFDEIECNSRSNNIYTRKDWRYKLTKLAAGLPSIDGIGNSNTDAWQDPEFVMDNGLKAVTASRNLATNFNNFLKISLDILGKKAFLLIFDDIDVDATKGWAVLETIRKYFISSRLITLLSGDLKLYSTVIRQKKWRNFGEEILKYEGKYLNRIPVFNDMVTELTTQYLLKIMQPKYRIHLTTILEKKTANKAFSIFVYKNDISREGGERIELLYRKVFASFGISNLTQAEVYLTFMLGQPLRSQIQFLLLADETKSNVEMGRSISSAKNESVSDVFLNDLLEKNIDINLANNSAKYLNIIILKLLLKEQSLSDLYQLQPTTTDSSLNAVLFSLSILFSTYIKQDNLFLIFDYLIKIGYVTNLTSFLPHRDLSSSKNMFTPSIEDLCEKANILNDGVLRDSTGYMQTYLLGYFERNKDFQSINHSFIQLEINRNNAKKYQTLNAVFRRGELKKINKILAYIPCFSGVHSYENESETAFSIYLVIGAIGEIVKNYETVLIDNLRREKKILGIKALLMELSQLRAYPIADFSNRDYLSQSPSVRPSYGKEYLSYSEDDNEYDDSDNKFAILILNWLESIQSKMIISPHLIGKISTRFFYSLNNLIPSNPGDIPLGDLFHFQIVAFLNAILIEDTRENLIDFTFLDIDNTILGDSIFMLNLRNLNKPDQKIHQNKLIFSKWLLACPLLLAYLSSEKNIKEYLINFCEPYIDPSAFNFSITNSLNFVGIKIKK